MKAFLVLVLFLSAISASASTKINFIVDNSGLQILVGFNGYGSPIYKEVIPMTEDVINNLPKFDPYKQYDPYNPLRFQCEGTQYNNQVFALVNCQEEK